MVAFRYSGTYAYRTSLSVSAEGCIFVCVLLSQIPIYNAMRGGNGGDMFCRGKTFALPDTKKR
jgi:hypothetical protein